MLRAKQVLFQQWENTIKFKKIIIIKKLRTRMLQPGSRGQQLPPTHLRLQHWPRGPLLAPRERKRVHREGSSVTTKYFTFLHLLHATGCPSQKETRRDKPWTWLTISRSPSH